MVKLFRSAAKMAVSLSWITVGLRDGICSGKGVNTADTLYMGISKRCHRFDDTFVLLYRLL